MPDSTCTSDQTRNNRSLLYRNNPLKALKRLEGGTPVRVPRQAMEIGVCYIRRSDDSVVDVGGQELPVFLMISA